MVYFKNLNDLKSLEEALIEKRKHETEQAKINEEINDKSPEENPKKLKITH
jgi:hypothetical protein